MDIKLIPTEELLKDRRESIDDIRNCEKALLYDITSYSGGSVQERLDVNYKIVDKIDEELKRRKC